MRTHTNLGLLLTILACVSNVSRPVGTSNALATSDLASGLTGAGQLNLTLGFNDDGLIEMDRVLYYANSKICTI